MIPEILASIGQFIWIYSYLPQLIKTYKTKNVEGMSLMTWITFAIGYLIIMPILIKTKVWILLVGYLICLFLVLIQISFIWRYKQNETNKKV